MKIFQEALADMKSSLSSNEINIVIADYKSLLNHLDFLRPEKLIELEKLYIGITSGFKKLESDLIKGEYPREALMAERQELVESLIDLINFTKVKLTETEQKTYDIKARARKGQLRFYNSDEYAASPFKPNYRLLYQGFPVGYTKNTSQLLLDDIEKELLRRRDRDSGIWVDPKKKDQFNLIYNNTNALYFLIQNGHDLTSDVCAPSVEYLDSIREISIDNRAKWYFDIQMNRITEVNALKFIDLLQEQQITDATDDMYGAFVVFEQGGSGGEKDPNEIPKHYGGFIFHASLIADVCLHMGPQLTQSRLKATEMLKLIRGFLNKVARKKDGWIIDSDRKRSPQFTSWYYVLCEGLDLELPDSWEANIREICKTEMVSMFKTALLVMNLALVMKTYRARMEEETLTKIRYYFEMFFDELQRYFATNRAEINYRDLCLFGRSILYINDALKNKG